MQMEVFCVDGIEFSLFTNKQTNNKFYHSNCNGTVKKFQWIPLGRVDLSATIKQEAH